MAQPSGTAHPNSLAGRLSETLGDAAADESVPGFVWTLLPRHGRRPLRFVGRAMLRADNRAAARADALAHWSEIQIFELQPAGFVTAVRHVGIENDRAGWQDAWLARDAGGVITMLCNHDGAVAWPHAGQGPDCMALRQAWLALLRAVFGTALVS